VALPDGPGVRRRLAATGLLLAGLGGVTSILAGVAGALTAPPVPTAVSLASATPPPSCAGLKPPPSSNGSTPSSGTSSGASGTVTVTVAVQPVVGVELDSEGHPYAVRTNTGAAPSCADYFWIFTGPADAVGHPGNLAQVNDVMASPPNQVGPWKTGIWRGVS
jgi:hypothetical protein